MVLMWVGEHAACVLFSLAMYLLAGYYSFEQMALTAIEPERYFLRDLRNGVAAARVVWCFYVVMWLPLRVLQWSKHVVKAPQGEGQGATTD